MCANKPDFVRSIFRTIVAAIKHCHDANISHRDIKLDNILVNESGELKIIDFGFAVKRQSRDDPVATFCGTPTFMCPEIIRRAPYDPHKADVWALGVLLFKLTTGRYPFRGESDVELNSLIVKGEVKYDKGVDEGFRELVEGMLRKGEKERVDLSWVLQSEWLREEEGTDITSK